MGEAERGESAPRRRIPFWCANGHDTRVAFASEADTEGRPTVPVSAVGSFVAVAGRIARFGAATVRL